ncbi:MAG: hypothetical protein JWR74_2635 [Polaromonas sp.]|jgi:hypothetical protein|nr:hypothetical protein [Polaromonas sp.]
MHAPREFAQFSFVVKIYANFFRKILKLLMLGTQTWLYNSRNAADGFIKFQYIEYH